MDPSEVDVECTSGKDEYVTGNTWEIDLNVAGRDRKCTVGAEGLVAQYYFEVDNVLFNGLLGSSNTAVGLISILLIMILAVLIVLIKKDPNRPKISGWMKSLIERSLKMTRRVKKSNLILMRLMSLNLIL